MVKMPPFGLLTTFSCAGGGVQVSEPESVAVRPTSAVAFAAGLGCAWQAAAGVLAGLDTVIVAEACAASVPSEQFRTAPVIVQVPCVVVDEVHVRPPLVGSVSL